MNRLLEARKFLNLTQKQIGTHLGIGQNTYSMIETGKIALTSRNRTLLIERLHLNPIWLDTGNGDMFLLPSHSSTSAVSQSPTPKQKTPHHTIHSRGVPYHAKPITGINSIPSGENNPEAEYYINFPPFNDCTFYRPVFGESMSPCYNPGDLIACKRVLNKNLILYGESYLCIIDSGGDFYETLKILRRSSDPEHIILKPINPLFDETTIHINDITQLYIIKGKIERSL